MGRLIILFLFLIASLGALAQTCTISCAPTPCTVLWSNATPTCATGGTIIVPANITLEFDNTSDTWKFRAHSKLRAQVL